MTSFFSAIRQVLRPAAPVRFFSLRGKSRRIMDPLIIIFGSTGTGKSDLAVELASRYNGEVVNADAMQMYKGLPIITNKLTTEEQRGVPHHLLGNIELDEDPWTVENFQREATKTILDIRSRGRLPIVVGGTSYYIDRLLFGDGVAGGQDSPPSAPQDDELGLSNEKITREELYAQHPVLSGPTDLILQKLREVDPIMAAKWHPNDRRKIQTSLEIYLGTGRRASDIYAEQRIRKASAAQSSSEHRHADPSRPWNPLLLWLYAQPEALNPRLEQRVDKMVDRGLLAETSSLYATLQSLLARGHTINRTKGIWQSIGFRQFEPYLEVATGLNTDLDPQLETKLLKQGIEATQAATRRYAKYQVRWITYKTISALREENMLEALYLLDATSFENWQDEVLEKGAELMRKFLSGEPLPAAASLSPTAAQVLAEKTEKSAQKVESCHKVCDVCGVTVLTEPLWKAHLASNRHRKSVASKKRRALVAQRLESRALVAVETKDKCVTDHPASSSPSEMDGDITYQPSREHIEKI